MDRRLSRLVSPVAGANGLNLGVFLKLDAKFRRLFDACASFGRRSEICVQATA